MKKKIIYIILIILCCGLGYGLFTMRSFANGIRQDLAKKQEWLNARTHIYFIDVPAGLDTIDYKAEITLAPSKTIHKLSFPGGGTRTTVQVYDSNYLRKINRKIEATALVEGSFAGDEEALLDITSLSKGIYFVHYLSCGKGGIFPLIIH